MAEVEVEQPKQAKLAPERLAEVLKRVESSWQLEPEVKIKLKGADYILEFNNFAAKRVYKLTGFNALSDPITDSKLGEPVLFGAMLHSCLLTHHPEMTEEQCDKLCSFKHMEYITLKLTEALGLYQPKDSATSKRDTGKTEDPTDPT